MKNRSQAPTNSYFFRVSRNTRIQVAASLDMVDHGPLAEQAGQLRRAQDRMP
jgi:hypothetical protein